jgi:chemotaxis protein methyltransferase CheR
VRNAGAELDASPTLNASPELHASAEAARRYAARDYDGVVELASPLVQRGEDDAALSLLLVRALANRGELADAGRACAAALDRHRGSAELAYLHAVLLLQGSRPVEAAAAARRALYLDRDLVVAHLALGDALARTGDVAGARRAIRNAQRLLASLAPEEIVPASDGEPAGHLAELARAQLSCLPGAAG